MNSKIRAIGFGTVAIAAAIAAAACSSNNTDVGGKDGGRSGQGASGNLDGAADAERSGNGGSTVFGSGGGSGQGAGQNGGPDGSCGESRVDAKPKDVNVLLVIDRSGSMAQKPSGFSTDKWTAMKTALSAALNEVKPDIAFGLELFPYPADVSKPIPVECSTNCCEMPSVPGIQVPVEAGVSAVPKIIATLTMPPGGGTPTAVALERAHEYFTTGAGKQLKGDKYVLLATDGGPDCNTALSCGASSCVLNLDGICPVSDAGTLNCCDPQFGGAAAAGASCLDDARTKLDIQQLATAGVKTFVVGIPGSEAYATALDQFAQAGGEVSPVAPPKYYEVTASGGVAALTNVLTSITKTLITSCSQQLTSSPADTNLLNVLVDGTRIPRVVSGAGSANGWRLDTSTTPPTVVLTGSVCQQVETKGAQSVQVLFGCPTVSIM